MRLIRSARVLALVLLLALLSGCGATGDTAGNGSESRTVFAMDTVMELNPCGEHASEACDLAEERILKLESELSVTDPGSDLYAVNHAQGQSVTVSEDTAALLREALTYCARTDGALDVSIYPVLCAWGFTTESYQVPSDETLRNLLQNVDYTRVQLDDETKTVTIPDTMQIDLGSVAKGYTGDLVIRSFRDAGVTSAMINLGGNVQVLGSKPDGSPWRIGVQDPGGEGFVGVISASDLAVVTSGGYERFFEQDGVTYWHILDPETGAPAHSGVVSSTIVGKSGTMCDALSTALFVMGKDRAAAFWRSHEGFDFLLVMEDGSLVMSEGLESRFEAAGAWTDAPIEVIRK